MAEVFLGVNNGFALKNWPEPMAWARIIAEELGLKEVQFSFDLLDPMLPEPGRSALCQEIGKATEKYGISLRTTFTGLIVYAQNHLAHPNFWLRNQAWYWFESALEATSMLGAEATGNVFPPVISAKNADRGRPGADLPGCAAGPGVFSMGIDAHPQGVPPYAGGGAGIDEGGQ